MEGKIKQNYTGERAGSDQGAVDKNVQFEKSNDESQASAGKKNMILRTKKSNTRDNVENKIPLLMIGLRSLAVGIY